MSDYLTEPTYTHGTPPRVGILLLNLGTPDEPTPAAVRRYLKQFLSDRRVVEIPRAIWWVILNAIILTTRPKRSGPSKAVPERDAHATVTVKTVESAAPAARRSVSTTRQKSARQKTEASTTSAANAPTRQERRDARAAQEFVPPRAPEPAVPVRPTQADEFTP